MRRPPRKHCGDSITGADGADRPSSIRSKSFLTEPCTAVVLVDPGTGEIIDLNREAERITKRSRRGLVGASFSVLFPREEADRCRILLSSPGTGGGIPIVTSVSPRGGKPIPVWAMADCIDLGSGRKSIRC